MKIMFNQGPDTLTDPIENKVCMLCLHGVYFLTFSHACRKTTESCHTTLLDHLCTLPFN